MMRAVRILGLVLGSTVALTACGSDSAPATGSSQAGAAGSVGSAGAAGSAATSAGSAGTLNSAAGSAGSQSIDQGGGGTQAQVFPCSNKIKDGTETDVDCGSDCSQCALGKMCVAFSDCASAHCVEGVCKECSPNTTECSGNKVASCVDGKWVEAAADCPNGCDSNTSMCKP